MNTNTDLTEEEAADLQFPKAQEHTTSRQHMFLIDNKCGNCENELVDRYIACVDCNENICLYCFSNGVEFQDHKNDHSYKVIHTEFNLFDQSDWTAKEELALLNGLLNHGNWHVIAKQMQTRTVAELKKHYDHFYLEQRELKEIPIFKKQEECSSVQPIICYRTKLTGLTNPIRDNDNMCAGYSAARSDFEYDYDKNAEDLVTKLESVDSLDPHYQLQTDLQVAILNIYRRRIGERERRKQILREHGLIMPQKTKSWLQRYHATITASVYERLVRFMQFYTGQGFVYLLEGLHRAGELRLQISRLIEQRKRGIKTLEEARLYTRLKHHREECMLELKRFQQASELSFKYKQVLAGNGTKRRITPLEIAGLPGYDKLSTPERDLCRSIRLSPTVYLEVKSMLVQENNKLGFLRLHTARRLLKIDVNKTRKLYDFLMSEGYIQAAKNM